MSFLSLAALNTSCFHSDRISPAEVSWPFSPIKANDKTVLTSTLWNVNCAEWKAKLLCC